MDENADMKHKGLIAIEYMRMTNDDIIGIRFNYGIGDSLSNQEYFECMQYVVDWLMRNDIEYYVWSFQNSNMWIVADDEAYVLAKMTFEEYVQADPLF